MLAAGVRAHQAQLAAQEVDQMLAGIDAGGDGLAVDGEGDVVGGAHAARASSVPTRRLSARASSTRDRWRFMSVLPCWSAGGSRSLIKAAWAAAVVSGRT